MYVDVVGKAMGCLDFYIGEDFKVTYARFMAPKTYFYEAVDSKGTVIQKKKTKGFPGAAITYERLKTLLINNGSAESKVTWDGIRRDTFQRTRRGTPLQLKNVIFERVIDFKCFKKTQITELDGQIYFINFNEFEY